MEKIMEHNFEIAHEKVKNLIETFDKSKEYYLSPAYSEAEVRQDFIDKFFTALGWDVIHEYQKNPYQQEVKVEKAQIQEGSANKKRADYAFSLAPDYKNPKFFVEAKKPSRTLLKNNNDYFQTAKYGWNAHTGVSILTDFEEFVIIDCRYKPDVDIAKQYGLEYYKYHTFLELEKFSEVYWLFSREAVIAGNLDTYIAGLPSPKGTPKQLSLFRKAYQPIDESFLNYIDDVRIQMATAFFNSNPNLSSYELTEATQRTIDRLVFIRFLEDKQIEGYSILEKVASSPKIWAKFISECKELDTKYNGVVFKPHFIDQDNFIGADEIIFRDIISDFEETNSPYDFNYIPIHVLGSIYERFLGKIIAIQNNKVSIEDKPDVRKAGGVYYTPKYIVDYIVKSTVGEMIDGKSLNAIKDIKIADISCGSGSFLIGVYDYILNYYKNYYNEYPTKAKADGCIYDFEHGSWVLSIHQKQQILLNHIYGVDIDQQAIEVTQLSLFLKLLEDETLATANEMQVLFHQKILPDLTQNIQCGNSLVGHEVYENSKITDDELLKINPFDFKLGFSDVFNREKKGFDVLVGNPPYVKEYTNKSVFEIIKQGNLGKYYQGKMDLWYFFVAHGLDLLAENGKLGYIVPNNWVSNAGASILRNKVIDDSKLLKLIDFAGFMIFDEASIQTMVMVLEKNSAPKNYNFFYQIFDTGSTKKLSHYLVEKELTGIELTTDNFGDEQPYSRKLTPKLNRTTMRDKFLKFNDTKIDEVLNKIQEKGNFTFDEKKEIAQGIVFPQDFLNQKNQASLQYGKVGMGIFVLSDDEKKNLNLNKDELNLIKPYYISEQVRKYFTKSENKFWTIYTNSTFKEQNSMNNFPNLKNHLDRFTSVITSANKPYGLHRSRKETFFQNEKIICQRKCVGTPVFSFSDFDSYVSATYNVIKTDRIDLKYLTGLLNSKLVQFWLRYKGKMQGENYQVDKEPLLEIPIVQTDKNKELSVIELVEQLIETIPKSEQAKTDKDKNLYQNKIKSLEHNLNKAVYDIYGLSENDINILEMNL